MEQLIKVDESTNLPSYMTYRDYMNKNIFFGNVQQQNFTGGTREIYLPILYDYESNYVSNWGLDEFVFEGCEMETNLGIVKKYSDPQFEKYVIPTKIRPNQVPDHSLFKDTIKTIYESCVSILYKSKMAVKLFNFDNKMPDATGFKNPIRPKVNELTGEILHEYPFSLTLELISNSEDSRNNTIFTDLDENIIPWSHLNQVKMRFIPLLRIKHINIINHRANIQIEIIKAVITFVRSIHCYGYSQIDTINNIRLKQPNLANNVHRQLLRIAAIKEKIEEKIEDTHIELIQKNITSDTISMPHLPSIFIDKISHPKKFYMGEFVNKEKDIKEDFIDKI